MTEQQVTIIGCGRYAGCGVFMLPSSDGVHEYPAFVNRTNRSAWAGVLVEGKWYDIGQRDTIYVITEPVTVDQPELAGVEACAR